MTARKPLVLVKGVPTQLPAGDTLDYTFPDTTQLLTAVNGEAFTLSAGFPVYMNTDSPSKFMVSKNNGTLPQARTVALVRADIPPSTLGDALIQGKHTLTTGQWDLITGGSGGLTPGVTYYLGTGAAGAYLTTVEPPPGSAYSTRVGEAVSTTTMLIGIEPPKEATSPTYYTATFATATDAGSPIYTSAPSTVSQARANAAGTVEVVGLSAAAVGSGATGPVKTNGVLTLTDAEWQARNEGGSSLVAGTVYYLSIATAGKITTTPPTGVGEYLVKIGTALSVTDFLIEVGPVILL